MKKKNLKFHSRKNLKNKKKYMKNLFRKIIINTLRGSG